MKLRVHFGTFSPVKPILHTVERRLKKNEMGKIIGIDRVRNVFKNFVVTTGRRKKTRQKV